MLKSCPPMLMQECSYHEEFLLQNEIGRNGAKIDQAKFGKLIEYHWLRLPITKTEQPILINNVATTIRKDLNVLLEKDTALLTNGFDDTQLFVAMFIIREMQEEDGSSNIYVFYSSLMDGLTAEEKTYMTVNSKGKVRRKGIEILRDKVKEWVVS